MAHLAHYKRSGAAPMLAHYERRAELERGYSRENIDASRTAENYAIGAASPQALAAAARSRVDEAIAAHEADSGKAIRKDANVISDWVVTLPKDCPREDARKFFETAVAFCRGRYGAENVLGGFVHMDEATPHVHIPVVPVKDGRIRAAKVFTRSDLQRFHKDLGRAEDAALGRHVSVELDPAQQGEKQLSHLGQAEFMAAKDEARKAAEKASEARKAAQAAERAQKAAEDRKRASEAAAEASERARAQASDAAKSAKEDMQRQRDFAKRLGNQGKGIDWQYPDGHVEHESSVGEVRAERDAAKAEAAAAMKKRDDLLAFADEIRGERYEIDGRTYKGISAMADELKGLRADCAAAKNELAAAQNKAAAERRAAAEAEAAKAQAEALLSSLRDSEKEARARAQEWQERGLAHYHEMHLTPHDLLDALLTMACRVADVVCQLWVRARDIAVQEWNVWQTRDLPKAAGDMGIYLGDAYEISDRAMRATADAYRHPEIADDLLDMPEQEQEREDDWER